MSEQEQLTCSCGNAKYYSCKEYWWFSVDGREYDEYNRLVDSGWSCAREMGYCVECGDKCGPGPVVEPNDAELRRMAVEGDELSLRISLAQRALDGKLSGWRANDE